MCVCVIAHQLPKLQFGGTCTEHHARRQYILLQLFPPTIFVLSTTVIKQDHRVFLQHKQKRSMLHFRAVSRQ